MVKVKHPAVKGKEKATTSIKRKQLPECDNFGNFRDDECVCKYAEDFSRRKVMRGKNII